LEPTGTLSNCGWEVERWLDVVLMEKTIGLGSACTTTPMTDPD